MNKEISVKTDGKEIINQIVSNESNYGRLSLHFDILEGKLLLTTNSPVGLFLNIDDTDEITIKIK